MSDRDNTMHQDEPDRDSSGTDGSAELQPWRFTGKASEYFGIWLSNLFFSIITLGIYSAWAKVRRQQYFYGNTLIAGTPLQYHATGKQILIGRLLTVAILLALSVVSAFDPRVSLLTWAVVLVVAVPWFLNKALGFRCRVTSWHNIHFRWRGDYGEMLVVFLPLALGMVALIGLSTAVQPDPAFNANASYLLIVLIGACVLMVVGYYRLMHYVFNHLGWGTLRFRAGQAFGVFGVQFLAFLIIVVGLTALAGAVIVLTVADFQEAENSGWIVMTGVLAVFVLYYLLISSLFFSLQTMFGRVFIDRLHAGHSDGGDDFARFAAGYRWFRLVWIRFSNLVMIMLSVGLLTAYAQIRLRHYLVTHTAMGLSGDVESIVDQQQSEIQSLAAEFSDLEGFDFDLW